MGINVPPGMNAHLLFFGTTGSRSYHQALNLSPDTRKALLEADKEIRQHLRAVVRKTSVADQIRSLASSDFRKAGASSLVFELRFLRQGSFVYGNEIEPAHLPPQMSDLDDGIYARTSFFKDENPAIAAQKFFEFVERALAPLCTARGWRIRQKKTCVRIELNSGALIDLPLYAVPDTAFAYLEKSLGEALGLPIANTRKHLTDSLRKFRDLRIPTEMVMLAHRELGWVRSDPRKLHDWVDENIERYGSQLSRMFRYSKGWRDHTFVENGPSSIAIMACVIKSYQEFRWQPDDVRDDHALLEIAKMLPNMFAQDIPNPVLPGAPSFNPWAHDVRKRYIEGAERLKDTMSAALEGISNPEVVVHRIRSAFGDRIPDRPDLIKAFQQLPQRTTILTAAAAPLPRVYSNTSG